LWKLRNGSVLRITLLSGLILFVLAGVVLAVFYFIDTGKIGSAQRKQDSFFSLLSEYDSSADIMAGTDREFDNLNRELDRLERRAITVESWLSILKRRRALAALHTPSMEAYRESIKRAQKAYPSSQPIAAIAAAAVVKDTALNRQAEEQLRDLLPLFTDPSFNTMRLGLHILLGDFRNPEIASQFTDLASDGTEAVTVDLTILKILRDDFRGAAADIQMLLNSPSPPSKNVLRFAAEYYYDFGDLLRSAQVFSQIEDEEAMIRMADALYLSGYTDSARSIWTILAETPNENSLYNLAVTSEDRDEAVSFLERLVDANPESGKNSRQFGLIRYSRLLPYNRAIAVLEGSENLKPSDYPFIDLELNKRHNQTRESGRQVSEAWLLLDRHPENEDLYWWTFWLFFFQRYYDELNILMARVERLEFEGQWVSVYRAIQLMREGDLETAESILRSIPGETAGWHVFANLGLILESQRSSARALQQYEIAVLKAENPKIASRVQFRIARCFFTQNNLGEARRALEYAIELDPENLTAQLELERMLIP